MCKIFFQLTSVKNYKNWTSFCYDHKCTATFFKMNHIILSYIQVCVSNILWEKSHLLGLGGSSSSTIVKFTAMWVTWAASRVLHVVYEWCLFCCTVILCYVVVVQKCMNALQQVIARHVSYFYVSIPTAIKIIIQCISIAHFITRFNTVSSCLQAFAVFYSTTYRYKLASHSSFTASLTNILAYRVSCYPWMIWEDFQPAVGN